MPQKNGRVALVNERCCHIMCINDVNTLTFVRIAFGTVWNEGRSGKRFKRSRDCFVSFRDDFNMMFVVRFWNSVVWFGQAWLCSVEYVKCKSVIIYEDFGTMLLCSWLLFFDWVYWISFVTVLFEVSKLSKTHSRILWCMELQSATSILWDTKRYSATRMSDDSSNLWCHSLFLLMMQSLAFMGNHCFQYKHMVGHGTEKVFWALSSLGVHRSP